MRQSDFMFKTKMQLAKYAIEYFLDHQQLPQFQPDQVKKELTKKIACFVTIYIDKKIRGCVGNYIAHEPLCVSIIKNAINAAFFDSRFLPIEKEELPKLKIKISLLTRLKKYQPKSINQLLQYLKKNKPGLLIETNNRKALFLPQVWEQLPKQDEFLSELCLKAGLPFSFWKEGKLNYWIFNIY